MHRRVCCDSIFGKPHEDFCALESAQNDPIEKVTPARTFHLNRLIDASGISGTGIVAHGIEFADGQCALHWRDSGSIGIYPSLKKLEEIHGHQGRTLVVMS